LYLIIAHLIFSKKLPEIQEFSCFSHYVWNRSQAAGRLFLKSEIYKNLFPFLHRFLVWEILFTTHFSDSEIQEFSLFLGTDPGNSWKVIFEK
jgi:hypothetical protein